MNDFNQGLGRAASIYEYQSRRTEYVTPDNSVDYLRKRQEKLRADVREMAPKIRAAEDELLQIESMLAALSPPAT